MVARRSLVPMSYLVRRLVSGLLLIFLISIATFALGELVPGDYLSRLELEAQVSRQTVEALRERYGLDQGGIERYAAWLRSVLAGDFGYSLAYEAPVAEILLPRAWNTLLLTVTASAAAWALALVFGTWMACRAGGWPDRLGLALAALLLALPQLALGLACLGVAAWSGLFPLGGMSSLDHEELGFAGRLGDLAWHLALPVAALTLGSLPVLLAHVRSALRGVLAAPYLRFARGLGVPERRLLFRYALPAAANPLVSLLGLSIASLFSGALVIEIILAWPGIGRLLVESVAKRDLHVIVGATFLSAVVVVLGQLLADVLLSAVDPRIRELP